MNVSAWSIRRPVPALLLFALLSVLGLLSFRSLAVQNFVDIDFPQVVVSLALEGAAPGQLESEVVRPVEDAVAAVGGVQHIRSAISEGSAAITVEFAVEADLQAALQDVRNAVDSVRSDLPEALRDPVVTRITRTGEPLITWSLSSDRLDEERLSWFIDGTVSKALLAVDGVAQVERLGGVEREVQVTADPDRLAALGLGAPALAARLAAAQVESAGGRGEVGGGRQSLRTLAKAPDAESLAALAVPLGDGRHQRLDQLARVRDGTAERTAAAWLDGRPAVGVRFTRLRGHGEVAVAAAARAAVARLQAAHPEVRFTEVLETVSRVEENYADSLHLLVEGALLAVVVVFWFLRDWRATAVAATALPLSILPTFLGMESLGFSLNTLTLLALALVTGILVDDAIVEVENIVRHLRQGKSPWQAAMEAADEIGLAVIATTLTLVAVFVPTAFMGGIPGKVFREFGWTAGIAVLASLLVARLLTPMMAAYLLKPLPGGTPADSRPMRTYLSAVRWCIERRWTTLVLAGLFLAASAALVPLLSTTFIPRADRGRSVIGIELAPGASLERTAAVAAAVYGRIAALPEVERVFAVAGGADDSAVRTASLSVRLRPRRERARSQNEVEAAMRQAVADLPGARITVGAGAPGERLDLVLFGDDPQALAQAVSAVQRDLRTIPGLGTVTSDASLLRPEIHIVPDQARAAELGVSASDLATAVRLATVGGYSSALPKIDLPDRQVPIRLRLADEVRQDPARLARLRLEGRDGPVLLGSLAAIAVGSGPAAIDRLDRSRRVSITVELGGLQLGDVMRRMESLPSLARLPSGVRRAGGGEAEHMAELFGGFAAAMAIGLLCIYAVLVLLFHDFLQPFTILAALPLAAGGALAALLATGNTFSMPSVIGLLMLMGIVTKNSILLVDYAVMARREHGLGRTAALLDACHKRARPILMTTIAMGAGMLPIACGWSADPSFRSPMAIAVVGGLATSTVLSLLVVPALFTVVDDLAGRLRPGRRAQAAPP